MNAAIDLADTCMASGGNLEAVDFSGRYTLNLGHYLASRDCSLVAGTRSRNFRFEEKPKLDLATQQ